MAKTAVNETKGATLPGLKAQPAPAVVQLTGENSLMYLAKFTEMMVIELRRLNANIEKMMEKDG
jgi:hypothetical protein